MGNFCLPFGSKVESDDDKKQQANYTSSKEYISKKREQRRLLIAEFRSTEETYLDGLNQLNSEWIEPLGDLPYIKKHYQNLWSNIVAIRMLHGTILPMLQQNDNVGKVILQHADYFKVYVEFISQYPSILQTLDEAQKKNKAVRKFFEQKADEGLSVSTLLITPIQRIPRYSLLLKELVKVGGQLGKHMNKKQHASEMEAQQKIDEIAHHLNESKRAIENSTLFLKVSHRIRGRGTSLWSPTRRYIDEMKFKVQTGGIFGRNKANTLFLFSDIAVLVNESNKFKKEYPLVCLRNVESIVSPKYGHGIFIRELTYEGDTASTITLWTEDYITAQKWVEKIKSARDEQIAQQGTNDSLKQLPHFYDKEEVKNQSSHYHDSANISISTDTHFSVKRDDNQGATEM